MFKMIDFLIFWTPVGVMSLIAPRVASLNAEIVGKNLGILAIAITVALAIQAFLVYPTIYAIAVRSNPFRYYRGILPALLTAVGTSSSAATLPVSIKCVQDMGVHKTVANFVMSLGATVNMDGTAIYFPIAVVWMGCTAGVNLGLGDLITICLVATLSSIGAAPIPSASLVLLVLILDTVHIPQTSAFALIYAMDWLFDRMRTTVNVTSDTIAAGIVQARAPAALLEEDPEVASSKVDLIKKLSGSIVYANAQ